MTFRDDSDISGGRTSRRGRNAGIALGAGGGGLALIVLLVGAFTGFDLSPLLGTTGGSPTGTTQGDTLDRCDTGSDANADIDCRMKGASAALDAYWSQAVDGYTSTQIVLFTGAVETGCGSATSSVGPFYCPPDQTIYLDTDFYDELSTRFGASGGPLAQLYVVAHEWGHHIQNIIGNMDGLDLSTTGPASDGVRLELQADCFAGAWVGYESDGTGYLEPVTQQQIADALSAAAAVGDDRIQKATTGQVNPEGWTHGSSEERQRWFLAGYNGGPQACDTFAVSASEL